MTTTRRIGAAITLAALGISLTACTSTTDPDQVGLYYMQGSLDGNEFGHCTDPGKTDDYEWNNQIVYLPASLRTWTINDGESADSKDAIIVSAKPQKDQPSGVQVRVWSQTKFYLNTFCSSDGGVLREFWEKIGRRYGADTEAGWRKMLLETIVPALQKVTRDVIRTYEADALVGNIEGVQTRAQGEIATLFAAELNRLAGGPFFCGPSFTRAKSDCPPVEFAVLDIEFADPGIQQARNEKQKALEEAAAKLARAQGEAAALVAEAKGKADAAAELAKLYATPGWVQLQLEITRANALIEACKAARECTLVVGADGSLIMK
jgi:hypothetical protein